MSEKQLDVDGLQELMWNFAGQRVITVAARTGILDRLASNAMTTTDQVASDLGLDPLATGKVVRALTALGLVEPGGAGYRLVSSLRPHFQQGPENLTPMLEHSHLLYERWGETLESWLRGQEIPRGGPPDPAAFGAAMQAMGFHVARLVADALDLGDARRLLDLGGGFGHYARALCRASHQLRATVVDRPEVIELGRQAIVGTDLEDRIDFIGGDYLQIALEPDYDLVLEANVLHQESRQQAAELVRRGASFLVPGGRLVVVDFAIDDQQQRHVLGTLFAINMRSFGDTYPAPVIRGWMEAAGLSQVRRVDLSWRRWMIVGIKGS